MQAYNSVFARVYNQKWTRFTQTIAPYLLDYYASTPAGQTKQAVLDLCCGTGQLATQFLAAGYPVVGLDLSEAMLHYAIQNNQSYIASGQANFLQGDASQFHLNQTFGLVVSTYDALNHLNSLADLANCFKCTAEVCHGTFIFDLNTRAGLQHWNGLSVEDSEDCVIINTGMFDPTLERAWTNLSGFVRAEDGRYERFHEVVFNLVLEMAQVKALLLANGWNHVRITRIKDLQTDIANPESETRAFFVASK
jgi:Methylase involved in ubiquinone/menaquinone biosynthesis